MGFDFQWIAGQARNDKPFKTIFEYPDFKNVAAAPLRM
jgi:hypothetical protein